MDILDILERFGWLGVIIVWALPRVWSFLTDRLYPQRVKEREKIVNDREEGVRAEREARVTLLKAQIDREDRESTARIDVDKRVATALEQMALGITVGNERIAALIGSHAQHANFVFGAHVELKERLEAIEEMISYKNRLEELESRLSDTQERIKAVAAPIEPPNTES